MDLNKTTIIWDNENEGYESNEFSKTRVYKYSYGISMYERSELRLYITHHTNQSKKEYKCQRLYGMFHPLTMIRPKISDWEMRNLINNYIKELPNILLNLIKDIDLNKCDDFTFLSYLGTKRDWRSDCCICLTEEIMGTTCTCGHTEIVVFRPCGHSICMYPCFKQICDHFKVELGMKTFNVKGGETMYIPGKYDISKVIGLECPKCRSKINSTFIGEDVYQSK